MSELPNYNPETTEATWRFDVLPAGAYNAVVTKSELKDTKAGGKMLAVTLDVIDGPNKGRKIFTNYNLVNTNPEAEKIGHGQLKALATACGKPNARDSQELHDIPIALRLKIVNDEKYGEQNDITSYGVYAVGSVAKEDAAQLGLSAPAGAAAEGKPDWAAKTGT